MRRTIAILCAALLMPVTACGDDDAQGGPGQPCLPNDTCNAGLVCVDGVCADPADFCGDDMCDDFEDPASCPADCTTVCGDNMAEGSEVCDGTDLGGADCASRGFTSGILACADTCDSFDTSGCVSDSCGNNAMDSGETCDGTDLDGEDCVSQGFTSGYLACAGDCLSVDTAACNQSACDNTGNCNTCQQCALSGSCEAAEQVCSNNQSCIDYIDCASACGGDQACLDACAVTYWAGVADYEAVIDCLYCHECFNDCNGASNCAPPTCGNGQIDAWELCDGADFGGETCVSQGMTGGTLTCDPLCQIIDVHQCTGCGNDLIETGEVCDGTDLDGETCVSQGQPSGVLGCTSDCLSLDTSACTGSQCDGTGDCSTCQNCATGGPCTAETSACLANSDCVQIIGCASTCSDPSCVNSCIAQSPAGATLFTAVRDCTLCQECYSDCDGPSWGC